MPKIRFHKLAALAVLAGSVAWIATGEFSSVGSATSETAAEAQPPSEAEAAPVRTVAVVTPPRVEHARAIRLSGQTQADKRADLATRSAGIIAELPFRQGQTVKAGDVILMLDAEEKNASVETARQLVAQREAESAATQSLLKSGNVAKLQADTARTALLTARSQLELAEAELGRMKVVAPFSGVIDKISVEEGASVMQGASVATLLSLDPIIASGEVSERELGYIHIGDAAEIRLIGGLTANGTVRYISRDATSATRTFRVEVEIPNPRLSIPAGMTAEVVLRSSPIQATILPRSVVTLSAAGDLGIRAVDADDTVTFHPIDLVDDTPTGLVLGGIPADARIIVAGQDLVTEGDKVNVVEADAETIRKLVGEAMGGTN